jgi:hypothetical protein
MNERSLGYVPDSTLSVATPGESTFEGSRDSPVALSARLFLQCSGELALPATFRRQHRS